MAKTGDTQRTVVIVATYQESENILSLLDAIRANLPAADVLVVDDASPDGTGRLAEEYGKRHGRVHVLHRTGKLGLGTAILTGIRHAIQQEYDFAIVMDADFSHPPERLPDLVAGMERFDVMIGSRYVRDGRIVDWGWKRRFMSWSINVFSRVMLGLRARDCSGGFRCYRVAKIQQVDLDGIRSRGYSFQEEFLFRCKQVGCEIGETPITFVNRAKGQSKIDGGEAISALWILLRLSMRR